MFMRLSPSAYLAGGVGQPSRPIVKFPQLAHLCGQTAGHIHHDTAQHAMVQKLCMYQAALMYHIPTLLAVTGSGKI